MPVIAQTIAKPVARPAVAEVAECRLLRIKAVIANSPIVDLRRYMLGLVGGEAAAKKMPPIELQDVDGMPDGEVAHAHKLSFKASCRRFGGTSLAQWIERLKTFNAVQALGRLSCPALALVGTGEGDGPPTVRDVLLAHVWPCDAARV